MATGYTRQSTFIDGDVILAEHGNLEFDKLVNVFHSSIGHNHDGTDAGGAFVPLLKDPTGVQDFTLGPLGVTGSIVLDEDDMSSASSTKLATQQSIKAYVDTSISSGATALTDAVALLNQEDLNLQGQIDVFENSNHGHLNLDQLDAVGSIAPVTTNTIVEFGIPEIAVATSAPVDFTLENPLVLNGVYQISNSRASTQEVKIINTLNTIIGTVTVPSGTDVILEAGDSVSLLATSATTLEVLDA